MVHEVDVDLRSPGPCRADGVGTERVAVLGRQGAPLFVPRRSGIRQASRPGTRRSVGSGVAQPEVAEPAALEREEDLDPLVEAAGPPGAQVRTGERDAAEVRAELPDPGHSNRDGAIGRPIRQGRSRRDNRG